MQPPRPDPRPRRTARISRIAGLLVTTAALGIGLLIALAGPAQAHDELVSSTPPDQAQVPTVPASIVLTFAEPAEQVGSQVIVRGPSGDVAQGRPVFDRSTVTQAVRAGAPAGGYTVLWRVTSDDGHPVSGSFTFTAAAASASSATASPTTSPGGAAPPTTARPAGSGSGPSSHAPRWLWVLVLVLLLVPVGIFVRRRPGGPHDASPPDASPH